MPRCPTCGCPLPEDRDRAGARCPHCREPLYQRPGRVPREVRPGEAACTVHPGSVSVGTCGRCGNFLCETCRTRWADHVLCTACVERALRGGGAGPGGDRSHFRRAAFGLAGGIGGWVLTGLAAGGAAAVAAANKGEPAGDAASFFLGLLVLTLITAAGVLSLVGLGQSAAALRTRGDNMILATLGLLLSGTHVGALVGLFLFEIWLF